MKKLLLFLISYLFMSQAYAATYSACAYGCDYTTFAGANAAAGSGDTVLLKYGDTYTAGSMSLKTGVFYDAFGTGTKPTINGSAVEAVTISGVSNVSVKNWRFTNNPTEFYKGITVKNSSNITLDGIECDNMYACICLYAQSGSGNVSNVTIKNGVFANGPTRVVDHDAPSSGVSLLGNPYLISNITIQDSEFHHMTYALFMYAGTNTTQYYFDNIKFKRNLVHDIDEWGTHIINVTDNGSGGLEVTDNTVYRTGMNVVLVTPNTYKHGNGIWIGGCNTVTVSGNDVSDVRNGNPADEVGIFLDYNQYMADGYPSNSSKINIFKNKVRNIDYRAPTLDYYNNYPAYSTATGIGLMAGTVDANLYNNLVTNCITGIGIWGGGDSYSGTTQNNRIFNNDLIGNNIGFLSARDANNRVGNNEFSNNLVFNNTYTKNVSPSGTDLTAGSDFESGTNGWGFSAWGGGSAGSGARSTEQAHGGSYSYKINITTRGSSDSHIYFRKNITGINSQMTYKLTFWIYALQTLTKSGSVNPPQIRLEDTGGTLFSTFWQWKEITQTNQWVPITVYLTTQTTSTTNVLISFLLGLVPNGTTIYIDDISLVETNYDAHAGVVVSGGTVTGTNNVFFNNDTAIYGASMLTNSINLGVQPRIDIDGATYIPSYNSNIIGVGDSATCAQKDWYYRDRHFACDPGMVQHIGKELKGITIR